MASHQKKQKQQQLHFLFIPLFSQSHIIPLTDFAKLLARHRSVKVTIITTPLNASRAASAVSRASDASLDIHLSVLPFPWREAGLPEPCENLDSVASPDYANLFFQACEMMQAPLEDLLPHLDPKPCCIVSSNALPWTVRLANKFAIPRYVFQTISCFTLTCSSFILDSNVAETVQSDSEPFSIPGIPHKIQITRAQLPRSMRKDSDWLRGLVSLMREAEKTARGILCNSFEELEKDYFEEYKKTARRLWCIGPVCLANKEVSDKFDRGNSASIDVQDCLTWLDSKNPSSVLYVCFGSLCHISTPQLIEIGLGLESSKRPFIWIIRKDNCTEELRDWLKEEKFEARIRERGLIIRGWAPQVLILSHPAVGGFLTHCGWNSTLEGVCAGIPMATWPLFAEQFYNEKFLVDVLGVGVAVGVEGCSRWEEEQTATAAATTGRDRVREAVERLMDEGREGGERRKRAREFGELGRMALEEGGSSYDNISLLIQDVVQSMFQHEHDYD